MAVSGRKISDFKGSVTKGSAEDFENCCAPCLAFDKHVEPRGFCVDCQEHLCKDCYIYHQKVKVSRHHQLLDKDQISKEGIPPQTSDVCSERCSIHRNELIKFYCPKHEALGCTDCITLNHRTCDLDYIPDECADIGDSDEYRETIRKLKEKSNEAKDIILKAAVKDKEIDEMHDEATKEIHKFRQEINDRLDVSQKQSHTEISKRRSSDKERIQSVLATCHKYTSEIDKLKSALKDNKTQNQNGQLFIDLKRANTALASTSMQNTEESLNKVNTKYEVERNDDIKSILSKQAGLVKLCDVRVKLLSAPRHQTEVRSLTHAYNINLKTNSDKQICEVTGCEVLTADKLVIADYKNKAVKLVDLQRKCVADEKVLDSKPFGIAVLPRNQIAVTMPIHQKVLIMVTDNKLSTDRTFKVGRNCYGIVYHEDKLYVVCQKPRTVLVLDMQGNVKNTISLEDDTKYYGAVYIALSSDHTSIYVSTWGTSSVTRFTLRGEVTAVYQGFTKDVEKPKGITVLDDGSFLVCCWGSNDIYRIYKDFRQSWKMTGGLNQPYSICYSSDRCEVYVGSVFSDYLEVFRLQ